MDARGKHQGDEWMNTQSYLIVGILEASSPETLTHTQKPENDLFLPNQNNSYSVRGQHDTISEHATVIYGAIWGNGIKNLGEFDGEYKNTSFGSTMAYMLGIDLKDANAPVIFEILEDEN